MAQAGYAYLALVNYQIECLFLDLDDNPAIVQLPVMVGTNRHDIRSIQRANL